MKNATARLIVWTVIALLLTALMITMFLRPSFLSELSVRLPSFSSVSYPNAGRYTAGNGSAGGIESVDIDWVDGEIILRTYDGDEVIFEEEGSDRLSVEEKLHWYNDNGRLMIKYAAAGIRITTGLQKSLTVMLPAHVRYGEVKIDSVSSEIRASELYAERFAVDSVSGGISLDGIRGRKLDVETVSGALRCSGLDLAELEAETVSGRLFAGFAADASPKTLRFDSVSGEIILELPAALGFTAELDSVSGSVSTDFAAAISKDTVLFGSGVARISAESVSGDLTIRKLG